MGIFADRLAKGLCGRCGKNAVVPPNKQCDSCKKKQSEYQAVLRAKRKERSLCIGCGKKIEKGSCCIECKKKSLKYIQSRRRASKKCRDKLRIEAVSAYGNKCTCCGESELIFLTIDHIEGGGNKHRKALGGNTQFYTWLRANEYPPGFQVLCWNCNWAKSHGGCPHQRNI